VDSWKMTNPKGMHSLKDIMHHPYAEEYDFL
jgi:hypothetical protein